MPNPSQSTEYAGTPALSRVVAGERVALFADRALYWAAGRTLFVADVHLGKTAAFRSGGIALPGGATAANLSRLARLIAVTAAEALVVLGDFLHAVAGRTPALDEEFRAWRRAHASLAITLVRGNHDSRAGDPPPSWRIDVVEEPAASPPFVLCHAPPAADVGTLFGYALSGHVHPAVHLDGPGLQRERLPCFVLGRHRAILPAFGRFTGSAAQSWHEEDHIVAIAGERLFSVPRHAPRPRL